MEIVAKNLEETNRFANSFAQKLLKQEEKESATVVLLEGDLGSGKTAFTKALAEAFGVKETVISPTFIIERSYTLNGERFHKLIHIDAYRFGDHAEARILELETLYKNPHHLIVIEWPEQIAPFLPKDAHHLKFTFVDDSSRIIEVHA